MHDIHTVTKQRQKLQNPIEASTLEPNLSTDPEPLPTRAPDPKPLPKKELSQRPLCFAAAAAAAASRRLEQPAPERGWGFWQAF